MNEKDIPIENVFEVREKVGCSMMEAKRALFEVNGDVKKAINLILEEGHTVNRTKKD